MSNIIESELMKNIIYSLKFLEKKKYLIHKKNGSTYFENKKQQSLYLYIEYKTIKLNLDQIKI